MVAFAIMSVIYTDCLRKIVWIPVVEFKIKFEIASIVSGRLVTLALGGSKDFHEQFLSTTNNRAYVGDYYLKVISITYFVSKWPASIR